MFTEFAQFVGLHYALSHRDDTEYWRNCMNKTWDEALIKLKAIPHSGFQEAAYRRTYDFKYENNSGLQAIAAGMNWAPTNKVSIIKTAGYLEENLEKEFEPCIKRLNERKEYCEQTIKDKPSLFSVLKKKYTNN